MDRVIVMSDVDPVRSAIVAALEGSDFEPVRRPASAHPVDLLASDCAAIVFDATEGVPVVTAVRRIVRHPELAGTPVVVVIDGGRLRLVSQLPEAADFVVKPFAGEELRLRLQRLLSSRRGGVGADRIAIGSLAISLSAHEVEVGGRPVELTRQEFELLRYLATHRGRVLTRENLLSNVWGYDYDGGSRTIDIHVRRIRAKLGPKHASLIATVRGVGYKLVADPAAVD